MVNEEPDGHHITPQMGSGCFPSEGFGKASFFRNLKLGAASYAERDAENPEKYVSRPECYDLQISGTPFLLQVSWIFIYCSSSDQDEEIYGCNKSSGIYTETPATPKFRATRATEDCC